jgi:competence protein ComEA
MRSSCRYSIKFIRRERRAILIIVSVTMAVHFGGRIARSSYLMKNGYIFPDSLVLIMDQLDSPGRIRFDTIRIEQAFDPDTVRSQTLKSWGFPEDIAVRWVKFRNLVGGFHSGSQIRAIYGIDSFFYQEIKPFLVFEKSAFQRSPAIQHKGEQQVMIDINEANRDQWQELYGIGPFYAKRITNFRDKLGGFYSIDQVGETYYFPDSVFQKIRPYLVIMTEHQKIEINQATYSELAGHPYISSKNARAILNYRNQHGPYESVDDLKKIISLDTLFLGKIRPYLYRTVDTLETG